MYGTWSGGCCFCFCSFTASSSCTLFALLVLSRLLWQRGVAPNTKSIRSTTRKIHGGEMYCGIPLIPRDSPITDKISLEANPETQKAGTCAIGAHSFNSKKEHEGLESQSHCLCLLQNALWKFKSPRGWAHFSGLSFWKLAVVLDGHPALYPPVSVYGQSPY